MTSLYWFDKRAAERAVEFFPRWLRLVDAEWAGKPFHLADWQAHHTGQIFGWKRRDGRRRYRRVRGWVPRKNGKTEWMAGVAHLLTIGDGEPGAQVYSYATDQSQANLMFNKAVRMAALSPKLAGLYEVTAKSLFCSDAVAVYRALSGVPRGKHGLSPHGTIGDEAHEWKNGALHTFLVQGMGSRRQPLDVIISTAGEIKTYGHDLYLETEALIADPDLDPETYVFRYAADRDEDWTSHDVWRKANPNLGVSLKLEFLEGECRQAMQSPRRENDFRRYHLNQWVEQATRWLPMHRWQSNTSTPKVATRWQKLPGELLHRRAFGGLDLASVNDMTALVWVFPPVPGERRIPWVCRFWVPEETVALRDSPRTPYRKWVASGALLTTPGNVTDYDFIEAQVLQDAELFKVEGLAIDRYNATQVGVHLTNEGIPVQLFGQGFYSMSAPSKEVERLFLSSRLEHGNQPVLEFNFRNATYRKNPAGDIKPDKEHAAEKIDGLVGGIMGTGLLMASQGESMTLDDWLKLPAVMV